MNGARLDKEERMKVVRWYNPLALKTRSDT